MFEVGDKVKIIKPITIRSIPPLDVQWVSSMDCLIGEEKIIKEMDSEGRIWLKGCIWTFISEWLEPIADETENKDGWIKHDGGVMPVDPDTLVDLRFANGRAEFRVFADDYKWENVKFWRLSAPQLEVSPLQHESILAEAEKIVHGQRNAAYGHPLDNFDQIAEMLSVYLKAKLKVPLTAEDVAAFNIFQKLSRQCTAQKRDNLVDLAGYAETWQWVIDERESRKKSCSS